MVQLEIKVLQIALENCIIVQVIFYNIIVQVIFYVPGVTELVGVVGSVRVPEPHIKVIISIGIVPEGD